MWKWGNSEAKHKHVTSHSSSDPGKAGMRSWAVSGGTLIPSRQQALDLSPQALYIDPFVRVQPCFLYSLLPSLWNAEIWWKIKTQVSDSPEMKEPLGQMFRTIVFHTHWALAPTALSWNPLIQAGEQYCFQDSCLSGELYILRRESTGPWRAPGWASPSCLWPLHM